jgi:hypothetical protein
MVWMDGREKWELHCKPFALQSLAIQISQSHGFPYDL